VTLHEQPALEPGKGARPVIRYAETVRAAVRAEQTATALANAAPDERRQAARAAYEALRADIAHTELAKLPLDRLKEITQGRVRLGLIERAGYRTVGSVLGASGRLHHIPGVGPHTADQAIAAARQLQAALTAETRVRFDPDARTTAQTLLLGALHAYDQAKRNVPTVIPSLDTFGADLEAALSAASPTASKLRMFFTGSRRKAEARDGLARLAAIAAAPFTAESMRVLEDRARGRLASRNRRAPGEAELWQDYLARPVEYNGLLIEVAGLDPDAAASQGYLPADIARKIHDHPLDLSMTTASLRGYQAFGAKFALVQRRVIIGDEMGLGKTVQALAVMAHLAADGATHFLVVCPASVVVNWAREIGKHTKLTAHRLHGPDRDRNYQLWLSRGGVAVTTYEALRSMPPLSGGVSLGTLTVDEAHFAKNPEALRSKAVNAWAAATDRVLFLTGTPMENRVAEFRNLIRYLRPEIAYQVRDVDGALGGTRFRRTVAPVYLRRNQDDVLTELPPRLENEEWVELDDMAFVAYKEAVVAGNFMAMRRAAFTYGTTAESAKLRRLLEITDEATADGRKVVVFSFFRDVLDIVAAALGPAAVGPITGSVPAPQRQALVDEFSARTGPSVLVAQIQAGGVGLNIQAASVVVICEPQWNPAIEEQAIARAHRMGQVRRVDVHRLLSEDGVDARMLEITQAKRAEFDEYARRSDLAASTPDAVDVSDLNTAREVASQAEQERRIVELERKRLRLERQNAPAPPGRESWNFH
jgi:superfamily II DNA or RNA helicase